MTLNWMQSQRHLPTMLAPNLPAPHFQLPTPPPKSLVTFSSDEMLLPNRTWMNQLFKCASWTHKSASKSIQSSPENCGRHEIMKQMKQYATSSTPSVRWSPLSIKQFPSLGVFRFWDTCLLSNCFSELSLNPPCQRGVPVIHTHHDLQKKIATWS